MSTSQLKKKGSISKISLIKSGITNSKIKHDKYLSFELGNTNKAKFFDLNLINFSNKKERLQNNNNKVLGNWLNKLLMLCKFVSF